MDQFDKIIKIYFDKFFKNSKFETKKNSLGDMWTGFWIDRDNSHVLLVGHPAFDDSEMWFSNGEILDGWSYFDIKPNYFKELLKRYLKNQYDLKVENMW